MNASVIAPVSETWRDFSIAGKSAIVTGGARGIGRAIGYRLAGLGARVVLWDIDEETVEGTATELAEHLRADGRGADLTSVRVDVTDIDAVLAATEAFAGGGLDILVNNAGTTSVQPVATMPLDVWERTLKLNLTATYYCVRAAAPHLVERPGSAIVNISSSAGMVGGGGGAHYAASKAGVDGLTRHLARELAPNVRVNAIQPRSIETDLFTARYAHAPADREALRGTIPLGRFGQPMDIADAVAFLASDWASFITGQIILIDGGRTYQ